MSDLNDVFAIVAGAVPGRYLVIILPNGQKQNSACAFPMEPLLLI
jgi:hypothetical protein